MPKKVEGHQASFFSQSEGAIVGDHKKVLLLKPDKNLSLLEYTTLTATFQVVLNKLVWKWLSLNNKS